MSVTTWPHYQIIQLESMDDVRSLFANGAGAYQWLVVYPDGVHSADLDTLDEVERWLGGEIENDWLSGDETVDEMLARLPTLRLLVIQPRLCVLRYGALPIGPEDVPFLRRLVGQTLSHLGAFAVGNL